MAIVGLRGTGEFSVDFRPTNYRQLFTLLEPNGTAPLQALLSMASSESTDDPKFNHFRDELPDRVLRINNSGGYNTSATAMVVDSSDDTAFVVTGTIIVNVRTGEVMRASANANTTTHTLTVERGIGNSGTGVAMLDNDYLAIAGFADSEGGTAPDPISFDPTTDYNYTQIFKMAVSVSGTLQNTYLRTGDKEQEQLTKALKLHMGDMERAFFFGKRAEQNGSTAQPTRYTGGLTNMITNVVDAASAFATANKITEKEFDRKLVEDIFAYGSAEKVAFCGAKVVANMQEIGKNRWTPQQVSGSYGVSMTRYATFAGDLLVHLHPMFRQVPGMEDAMIILDMPNLNYRYMKGRDTQLIRDVHTNDFDGVKHQYLSECGLEMLQGKPHYYIKNWQTV
ncbi:MAG: DUF5309 family protein [Phycisphaerae bacterium]|nr:DUF5309 family protein [Phycisphaerae bacterium]